MKKAVSLIEYALLVSVVILALIAMKEYLKRAICGRWKSSVDVYSGGRQYSP